MKIRTAAFAVAVVLGSTAAGAQSGPPPHAADRAAENRIAAIVRSAGLSPIMRPIRRGSRYVVSAVNEFGEKVRVIVDAQWGEVRAVRARPWRAERYWPGRDGWSYPPRPPQDIRSTALPPPPAVWPGEGPLPSPPGAQSSRERSTRSAAVTPASPPLPKRRPERAGPAAAAPESAPATSTATEQTPPSAEPEKAETTPAAATPKEEPRVILPGGPQWTPETDGNVEGERPAEVKRSAEPQSGTPLPPVQPFE